MTDALSAFKVLTEMVMKKDKEISPKHSPLTITSLFTNLSQYQECIKSSNAFLYKHDMEVFLITTAHVLFDTPENINIASVIKCDRREMSSFAYSNYFDIAIFTFTNKR